MYTLAETISLAVDADLFHLYLVETEGEITKHTPGGEEDRQDILRSSHGE